MSRKKRYTLSLKDGTSVRLNKKPSMVEKILFYLLGYDINVERICDGTA